MVKLLLDGNTLLVSAVVNGKLAGTFILDTGSSVCALTPIGAKLLKLEGLGQLDVNAAGETHVDAPMVILDSVEIGDKIVHAVEAVIMEIDGGNVEVSGLIGMSFLRHFDFTIKRDFTLTLED